VSVIGILFLMLTGPAALILGIWTLRSGAWCDSVPLAEAAIDRALGVQPPPRNKWDRRFARAQAWFLVLLGASTCVFYVTIFVLDLVSE
jgi:hypothetical protein